jgi:hypothetical protein
MTTDKIVEVSGTLTVSDLARFKYFHYFHQTWWIVLGSMLILLAGVAMAAIVALIFHEYAVALNNGTPFLLLLLLWCFAVIVLPYTAARKELKTRSAIHGQIVFTFTPKGMRCTTATTSSENDWGVLFRVCETQSAFFLYASAASGGIIPKRFFHSAVDQGAWRQLVEQAIAPKHIVKPGFIARWC